LVCALNACAQRGSDSETSALGQQKKAAPNVSNQVYRNLNVIELRKKRIDIGDFAAKAEAEARRVLQSSKEDKDLRKGARELLNELGNDVKKPIIFGKITKADAYFFDNPEDLSCAHAKVNSKTPASNENICAGKGHRFADAQLSEEQIKDFLEISYVEIEGKVFENIKKWYVQNSNGYTGLGNIKLYLRLDFPLKSKKTAQNIPLALYCNSTILNQTGEWQLDKVSCAEGNLFE
jgi:hypothetical protein